MTFNVYLWIIIINVWIISFFYIDQRQLILESERRKQSTSLISNSVGILKEVFLPRGFPNSVSKDYTEYQIWDTVQVTFKYSKWFLTLIIWVD